MINLDDFTIYKKQNLIRTYNSLKYIPNQCHQAWEETGEVFFPKNFHKISNIVISGMGGSLYGGRIIKSLYDGAEITKIPIELSNNYRLPAYVDRHTLVILSSYSGNTEETLSIALQAKNRQAKIIGLTTGGKLGVFLRENGYPFYIFNPNFNPSQQPRIGFGYMIIGLMGLLSRLKKIPVSDIEIKKIVNFLNKKSSEYSQSPIEKNLSKRLALKFAGKIPVFIVSDLIEGASYAVRNMFHETAKEFSLHFTIPEANHHLLEGLTYPNEIKNCFIFIFIESDIDDQRNKNRLRLTKEIVDKHQLVNESIFLKSESALGQTMEFLQLGAWISFYLAILNNVDPSKIPWVDYFKEKLTKLKL